MTEQELFTKFWTHETKTTLRVIERIPEGSDYRPDPKSRTAQEIAWQIVNEERMIVAGAESGQLDFFGRQRPVAPMCWSFPFDIVHHRGQISTYLRPMGAKVPSIYGPSGDEG